MTPLVDGFDVLVVDDNDDAQEMFACALEAEGATVHAAASTGDAYELLRARCPGVVISDLAMPGDDGYAFLPCARQICGALPAILVSGYRRAYDIQRALDAGFDCDLAKPVEINELAAAVFRFASRAPET